jgi:NAD(P)-dependent dehydrogenase (short-subunit alcohol dehydrogenase family)
MINSCLESRLLWCQQSAVAVVTLTCNIRPRPNSVPYTMTKHAILGLTKSLSLDCRKYDIACCQIDIGNAATEPTERMAKGVMQANGVMAPSPRMDVQHVANAILYMASLPLEANV